MGSQLEQVKSVCCQLEDKKVTSRKKAEEQLRDLLNNSKITGILDNVSVTGSGRDWNWQDVYRASFGFMKKETEKIIDDLRKESKTLLATVGSKKRNAVGLFKLVIKKGHKHLIWVSVINDLLQCLDHPFMNENFGDDIVRILNDAVTSSYSRAMFTVGKDRNRDVNGISGKRSNMMGGMV